MVGTCASRSEPQGAGSPALGERQQGREGVAQGRVKRRSPWWRWATDAPADVQPQADSLADRLGGCKGLQEGAAAAVGVPGPFPPISTRTRSPSRAVRTLSLP